MYQQFKDITGTMEKHYRDMQDFEFTIQDGKLYMLQTRNGKRTGLAAVRVAIDMVKEGLITKEEAVFRVEPNQLYDFLVPRLVEKGEKIKCSPRVCRLRRARLWARSSSPRKKR